MIDHNSESASLLVRTLLRRFPASVVQVCVDTGAATNSVATEENDAIVLHRTAELTSSELTATIRTLTDAPIVAVSGVEHSQDSLEAGADTFLSSDEWLRLGSVVAELVAKKTSS